MKFIEKMQLVSRHPVWFWTSFGLLLALLAHYDRSATYVEQSFRNVDAAMALVGSCREQLGELRGSR